jgi:hypothetical protein
MTPPPSWQPVLALLPNSYAPHILGISIELGSAPAIRGVFRSSLLPIAAPRN